MSFATRCSTPAQRVSQPGWSGCEIVDQRVEPDITDIVRVEGKLDAPGEAALGSRDTEVVEPAAFAQHCQDFVAVAVGPNPVGVLFELLAKRLEVTAHLEEVVGFGAFFRRTLMVLAQAVDHIAVGQKAFAADAVEPLVLAKVDVALRMDDFQEVLDRANVIRIRGANEAVVGDAQFFPSTAEDSGHAVGKGVRIRALGFCGLGDFVAVLVGPGQKESLVADQAVIPRDGVPNDRRVRMPDVRLGIDVVDGGRNRVVRHRLARCSARSARSATI